MGVRNAGREGPGKGRGYRRWDSHQLRVRSRPLLRRKSTRPIPGSSRVSRDRTGPGHECPRVLPLPIVTSEPPVVSGPGSPTRPRVRTGATTPGRQVRTRPTTVSVSGVVRTPLPPSSFHERPILPRTPGVGRDGPGTRRGMSSFSHQSSSFWYSRRASVRSRNTRQK